MCIILLLFSSMLESAILKFQNYFENIIRYYCFAFQTFHDFNTHIFYYYNKFIFVKCILHFGVTNYFFINIKINNIEDEFLTDFSFFIFFFIIKIVMQFCNLPTKLN